MIVTKLLKENEAQYLKVLLIIINNNRPTAYQLREHLSLSNTKLGYLINRLNEDLVLYDLPAKIVVRDDGTVVLVKSTDQLDEVIFFELFSVYLEHSVSYHLLQFFLSERTLYITDMMRELKISQPYTYKIVKKINEFLKVFHLSIELKNKQATLVGDEATILVFRYLYFAFLRKIGKINEDYLDASIVELSQLERLNDSEKIAYQSFVYTITTSDVQQERLYDIYQSDEVKHFCELLEINQRENLFTLFRMILFPRLTTLAEMDHYGMKIEQSLGKLTSGQKAVTLLTHVSRHFDLELKSSEQYYRYLYLLTLHFIYIDIFGFDFRSYFIVDNPISADEYGALYEKIIDFVEQVKEPLNLPKQGKEILIQTLFFLIFAVAPQKVTIYLDFLGNITAEFLLRSMLQNVFDDRRLSFSNEMAKADVVITNYLYHDSKNQTADYIYLQNVTEEVIMKQVFPPIISKLYQNLS